MFRFRCDECKVESIEILSVHQERHADCGNCGRPMTRLWDAPAKAKPDFIEGYDIGLDQTFSTQSQRDEYLARNAHDVRRVKA